MDDQKLCNECGQMIRSTKALRTGRRAGARRVRERSRRWPVLRAEAIQVLRSLPPGLGALARDIVEDLIAGESKDDRDADTLFRTLLLDEGFEIGPAKAAFESAWTLTR